MSEKVVLPKFDLPGHGPHPAVLAIKIAAGALGLALVVLIGALWRSHSLQVAAEEHAQAVVAERTAQALAAVEAAKARTAEAQAKIARAAAAAKMAAAQPKLAAGHAGAAGAEGVAAADDSAHHHHHGANKSKALAKSEDRKPARPSSKRDDAAIDKLLASFK